MLIKISLKFEVNDKKRQKYCYVQCSFMIAISASKMTIPSYFSWNKRIMWPTSHVLSLPQFKSKVWWKLSQRSVRLA